MILLFFSDDIGLDTIYLNDINLDGGNFDEDNPEKLFMLRLLGCCDRFKHYKKTVTRRVNACSIASN